jgi:hypothetical protein
VWSVQGIHTCEFPTSHVIHSHGLLPSLLDMLFIFQKIVPLHLPTFLRNAQNERWSIHEMICQTTHTLSLTIFTYFLLPCLQNFSFPTYYKNHRTAPAWFFTQLDKVSLHNLIKLLFRCNKYMFSEFQSPYLLRSLLDSTYINLYMTCYTCSLKTP